jgi:hypothetical protein
MMKIPPRRVFDESDVARVAETSLHYPASILSRISRQLTDSNDQLSQVGRGVG